ncbi:MAG: tRNA 2-thiouridine(34) synthase MnmA [Anaerolineae bacterium]
MPRRKRIMVAQSGGVDSAVATTLLLRGGHEVAGVTMHLWQEPSVEASPLGAVDAARQVCQELGIPHHVLDVQRPFYHEVVEHFICEYAQGRTPNPCVRCNRLLKFGRLLDYALEMGYDLLATGHYARIEEKDGRYALLRALDARKDQSYVLYTLGQQQLAHLVLPLGGLSKVKVRELAKTWGLPVAARPESQDICFLHDGDYRRFVAERLPGSMQPGPIVDTQGRRLGSHRGLPRYTIGQREGLGIAAAHPLYVKALDVSRNALVVGFAEELGCSELVAADAHYVSGQAPEGGTVVDARIRYRARAAPASVWPLPGDRFRVVFDQPLRDITPGQAVVLYREDRVLGGGIIVAACEQPTGIA